MDCDVCKVNRKVSGVLCERRNPERMKGKVHRTVLSGLETVALSKRQEEELEGAQLKRLRFGE